MGRPPETNDQRPLPGHPEEDDAPEDLWFVPQEPDTTVAPTDWEPRGSVLSLSLSEWRSAQAAVSAELAGAAAAIANLDTRLRYGRPGWHARIVQKTVSDLGWHLVGRIPEDRLALFQQGVLAAPADLEDARNLRVLGWAARRWSRPVTTREVRSFLGEGAEDPVHLDSRFAGRGAIGAQAPMERAGEGADFSAFEQGVEMAGALHPIVQAIYAMAAWNRLGLEYERAPVQGVVLASVIGASALRGGLRFVPFSLGGGAPYTTGGTAEARCRNWLAAAEQGAQRGLLEIDRIAAWRERALGIGRGGKALPGIVDALEAEPAVSARRICDVTGLSRGSAQALLRDLQGRGLVRELTGNDRYRVFTAAA